MTKQGIEHTNHIPPNDLTTTLLRLLYVLTLTPSVSTNVCFYGTDYSDCAMLCYDQTRDRARDAVPSDKCQGTDGKKKQQHRHE